jgi:AcrR family transcriptional regulator
LRVPLAAAISSLTAPLRDSLRPRKGELTRAAIVEAALAIARRDGLEGLTIGELAAQMRMSKSGVFAHFGSREELQRAVLAEYAARFVAAVLAPAVRRPRGLARLQAILDNWLKLLTREIEQGCLMISGSIEYDDRPGPMREAVVGIIGGWTAELLRAIEEARASGELRADTDASQLAFEIYGLMLGFHQNARLLRAADSTRRARAGLRRLIEDVRSAPASLTPAAAVTGRTRSVSGRAASPIGGKARTSSP